MRHTFKNPLLAAMARIAERYGSRMGYVDAQQLYSDAQALTVTAASTNIIDHGQDRNIGVGTPMAVVVTVDVAAAGGGTLTIALQADDNSGFASPATAATTAALAAATLVAGAQVVIPLPPDTLTERFSRLNYTMATMTGITVTAYLCPLNQVPVAPQYAAGVTVSN
jgi:hypothetical protein